MKKIIAGLLVLLLGVVSLPGIVYAQNADATQDASTVQDTTTVVPEPTTGIDKIAERAKRIQDRKAAMADKLSSAQESRIAKRCAAAQEKVTSLKTRTEEAINKRITRYNEVTNKLGALLEKLNLAGVDTTVLQSAITEYKAAVNSIQSSVVTYTATLDDLAVMDCGSDPAGFKATLEAARTQLGQVISDSNSIKDNSISAIKAALKTIREGLAGTN